MVEAVSEKRCSKLRKCSTHWKIVIDLQFYVVIESSVERYEEFSRLECEEKF